MKKRRPPLTLDQALTDLHADDPSRRVGAIHFLHWQGGHETDLLPLLHDPDEQVRAWAAFSMQDLVAAGVMKGLIAALEDSSLAVRLKAIDSLTYTRHPEAGAALLRLVDDPNPKVRAAVIGASNTLRYLPTAWAAVWRALHDPAPEVRVAAVETLGCWQREGAQDAVIAALQDTDDGVRYAAVWALQWVGDARAAEPLLALCDDPAEDVRESVPHVLGMLGTADTVTALLERFDTFHDADQIRALEIMASIGDPRAIAPALVCLDHPNPSLRMSAVAAVGWLKAEAALPRLRELAHHDPSDEVRAVALRALGHFHPQAADVTRAALHDPAWQVRSAAISVAYVNEDLEVADTVAATVLQDATAHFMARRYLPKTRPVMYAAVAACVPSLPINDTAALVFGEFGDTRAIEPLRRQLADPTLTDDDAPRRERLITILARLGDSSVTPLLKPLLHQHQMGISREAIPVFAQVMGAAGVGDLVPLLMQGDPDIEARVARALETIGTPEALAAVADWRTQLAAEARGLPEEANPD